MGKKMGRPKLDEKMKKKVRVEIRLTSKEDEFLRLLSKQMGMTKTDTIITALKTLSETKKD